MSKPLGLLAVAVAALAVPFSFIPASHAAPDMDPPRVVDFEVKDANGDDDLRYFIEYEPAVVTIRVHILDEGGSDVYHGVTAHSESSTQVLLSSFLQRVSGDNRDGWYETEVQIKEGRASGKWLLSIDGMTDNLGNSTTEPLELAVMDIRYGKPVVAAEPTFSDANRSFTIPDVPNVEYRVNGAPMAPGVQSDVQGAVRIEAVAAPGFALDNDVDVWSHEFVSFSPFLDVRPGAPFYDDISWMQETGRATGWPAEGGREYRPTLDVNRDAMAAFLYRQAGSPAVRLPAKSPFKDVQPGQDHYAAIIWAHQKGITTGFSDGTFRPTQPINRDAMAAFLYRYAGKPAFAAPTKAPFKDVPASRPFAKEIAWMSSTGITTGYGDGTFRPLGTVKRDAMAAFIHRYDTKF